MKFLKELTDTTRLLDSIPEVLDFQVVGSAVYRPDPQDLDFMVLITGDAAIRDSYDAFGANWVICGEYDDSAGGGTWCARRHGNVNLIVTNDRDRYEKSLIANDVCAALNLAHKPDRIRVYGIIRDGKSWAQA
jgi:hypothetical protein